MMMIKTEYRIGEYGAVFDGFEQLVTIAAEANDAADRGDIDLQRGSDAMVVADVLFQWLEANVTAEQKVAIAALVVDALGLEG